MKSSRLLDFLRSIQGRLLLLLIVMTLVAISAYTAITVSSAFSVGSRVQRTGERALRANAEEYLQQVNARLAAEQDLILDRALRDAKTVADAVRDIYESPSLDADFWVVEDYMQVLEEGQYVNGVGSPSSVFVPSTVVVDDRMRGDIERGAYLDLVVPSIFQSNPNVEAVYFSTTRDVLRYYPNIDLGSVLPHDFAATQRIWFSGSTPDENPQGEPWWTPVYEDATGLGLITTAAVPVYNSQRQLIGVVGFDITLDEITANIVGSSFMESGYSFLLDETGRAIALPPEGYRDFLGREPGQGENYPDMTSVVVGYGSIVRSMMNGENGMSVIAPEGRELFVAFTPLQIAPGWSLGSVIEVNAALPEALTLEDVLQSSINTLLTSWIIPIAALIFLSLVAVGLFWTRRAVQPLEDLAAAAKAFGAGEWHVPLPPAGKDEIGVLSATFGEMRSQVLSLIRDLEKRVAERTKDLERRSIQLQTAAEIARDIAGAEKLDELLTNAVKLVYERFNFYHAGIFLVDDKREYAVLRASASEAGRKMLEQGHKLKVGEVGIVGYVTRTGEARIAFDVGKDAVHFRNPLLPHTRSELALPLRSSERIIGALDVQSTQEAAFSEEDITVLQTLADQLAVAIEKAALVSRLENALAETEAFYQMQVQEAWSDPKRLPAHTSFAYNHIEVLPAKQDIPAEIWEELRKGKTVQFNGITQRPSLAVPVLLRGEIIGVIGIEEEDTEPTWTQDEIAIVEAVAAQAGLTLENARLLEETRLRAARERLVGEITTRIRASNDPQVILQTALVEIRQALKAHRVQVLVKPHGEADGEGAWEEDS